MSITVMSIVLLAAMLHALWNFLVKNRDDKYISMSAVVLGHTFFALAAVMISPLPAPQSLSYLFYGALLHTGYQYFLLASYRLGDLSQVYPLARGVAPLLVTIVSVGFLGVHLTGLEVLAILVIGLGISCLALVRQKDGMRNRRAVFFSLCTGCFIAAYSLVDGIGALKAGTVLGFYGWLSILNALIYGTVLAISRPQTFRHVVTREWLFGLKGGGASFCAYALVIWSFTVAPIALVTAIRETSIIFAALLGVFFLKERMTPAKMLALLLTVFGIVLIRLAP